MPNEQEGGTDCYSLRSGGMEAGGRAGGRALPPLCWTLLYVATENAQSGMVAVIRRKDDNNRKSVHDLPAAAGSSFFCLVRRCGSRFPESFLWHGPVAGAERAETGRKGEGRERERGFSPLFGFGRYAFN